MREPLADAGPTDRVPPYRFSVRSRVPLADTDREEVVYYGRYTHHVDRAAMAYRRHLGIPPLGPPGHHLVVRSLALEYRASALFDDVLETFVRVAQVGRSSHTVDVRIERPGEEGTVHIADARVVMVGLDRPGGRPSQIPEEMRAAIASFEGVSGS